VVVFSGAFVVLQMPDLIRVAALVAFVLSGYVAGRILARRPGTVVLAIYLTGLTAAFVILKRYAFLELVLPATWIGKAIDLVGLSFVFFRQIHYVVDVKQGAITRTSIVSYLCYQLNPFTLLAGPIQRYPYFHEDWQRLTPLPPDGHGLRMTYLRILYGTIQVAFVAEACLWLASTPIPQLGPLWRPLSFYLFPAYVYFNFAGYCDIVIAGASLLGMRVPENFDRPWLARDMIEFWTRWHRTLSFWIRDYIFTPMYLAIARRQPGLGRRLVFACYFVTLFLAGVWHGATWNFVVFGVLNGLGVSAAKFWETWRHRRRGRRPSGVWSTTAARVTTFHFVCLTMQFLRPGSVDNLIEWSGRLRDLSIRLLTS